MCNFLKWIKVDDRAPDNKRDVLVWVSGPDEYDIGSFDEYFGWYLSSICCVSYEVTYWAELPIRPDSDD